MVVGAYISVICRDESIIRKNKKAISKQLKVTDIDVLGNELLIRIPEGRGMDFSFNRLLEVVSPSRADVFNLIENDNGQLCRWWYCL